MMHDSDKFTVTIKTIQMVAFPITDEDKELPSEDFARLAKATERAELGKLFVHKAQALHERHGKDAQQGMLQSSIFDIDRSNGRQELRELLDALKMVALEKMYPKEA